MHGRLGRVMAVSLQRRVDFPMLDPAGIVYYPQYWDLAHRFFEEAWEQICGIDYPTIISDMGLGFPVVSNEAVFSAPLRYGDMVNCTLWISAVGSSSCTWQYRFCNQHGVEVWSASAVTVCVSIETLAAEPIPEDLKNGLLTCSDQEV